MILRPFLYCLVAAAVGLGAGCGAAEEAPAPEGRAPDGSPRSVAARYVGDAACADCHEDLYRSYHRTGMGRSVSPFDPVGAPERLPSPAIYDGARDFYYEAFVRGDSLFQREYRLDEAGAVVHERIHPADYVIGSGNATRSYLMDVNGYVTEMPLTWYVERAAWDLSPGFEQTRFRFDRVVNLECMTCHNGRPGFSPGAEAHYTEVPLGITCERCHGPGGDHVEARLEGFAPPAGEPDPDIVHPARLDRPAQLDVCRQCHLTGVTVFAEGEDPTTYRPGTSLAAHRAVFVPDEQIDHPDRFGISSHAQRLALSACFEESAMTCTTCHDPHVPNAELGPDAFNATCRSCHDGAMPDGAGTLAEAEAICSRPGAHPLGEATTGDCVSCHLQKSGTSDIPHVTFTDHWIRRRPPAGQAPEAIERALVQSTPFELVRLTEGEPEHQPEGRLEEAVAYYTFYETRHRLPAYLERVVRLVREGRDGGADRAEARLVYARALAEQDSLAAALDAFEAATRTYPDDVRLWYHRGEVEVALGRYVAAAASLERATGLQPAFVEAHLKLGEAYDGAGRLPEAEAAYRAALARDGVRHPGGWNNLGFVLLRRERLDEAEAAFRRALALDPDLTTARLNLGSTLMLGGELAEAARAFEAVLRADPEAVGALGNLALLYAQQGRAGDARDLLRRLLRLRPGDARARALLQQLEGGT